MTDQLFVLDSPAARRFKSLNVRWLSMPGRSAATFETESAGEHPWPLFESIFPSASDTKNAHLLALEPVAPYRLLLLQHLFKSVIAGVELLDLPDLLEVMNAASRQNLFIGGVVDPEDEALILYRGDFTSLLVPLVWFEPRPAVGSPDWARFQVTDYGQTLRMGEYEVAADAILYDFDPIFRREAKKRLLEKDDSFGGALRRLRLQRGLSRSQFSPLSAKEVARIERGEVNKPHRNTLLTLASRLGVELDAIAEY